jgi:hypothetical protein
MYIHDRYLGTGTVETAKLFGAWWILGSALAVFSAKISWINFFYLYKQDSINFFSVKENWWTEQFGTTYKHTDILSLAQK